MHKIGISGIILRRVTVFTPMKWHVCIECFLLCVLLQYPEGYLEAVANKDKEKENNGDDDFDTLGKRRRKRKSAGLWSRQVDMKAL